MTALLLITGGQGRTPGLIGILAEKENESWGPEQRAFQARQQEIQGPEDRAGRRPLEGVG